jgi:ABC-type branched-subunit amino acid transport system substrate-binding protein
VWAIVGGVDGPTTHLAEQVVAKALLPLLSPVSTDKTTNLTNVPWMFSCLPGDHLLAPALAEAIAAQMGQGSFVLVSSASHDARQFTAELERALARKNLTPRHKHVFQPLTADLGPLAAEVVRSGPQAAAVVGDARQSSRVLAALQGAGFRGEVFGGPWMGRNSFLEQSGKAAEGVIFPLPDAPGESSREFRAAFLKRFQREPDYAAASTHDAVQMLVAAVRKGGLNRARIGDALRDLSPWPGVAGTIRWDPSGSNTRPVRTATIRSGAIVPLARRDD